MWELSKVKTKEKYIPVGDCPNPECAEKNIPFSVRHSPMVHKDTGKKLDLWFITCPKCDTCINFDEESIKAIKGYISVKDLVVDGYTKEVVKASPRFDTPG